MSNGIPCLWTDGPWPTAAVVVVAAVAAVIAALRAEPAEESNSVGLRYQRLVETSGDEPAAGCEGNRGATACTGSDEVVAYKGNCIGQNGMETPWSISGRVERCGSGSDSGDGGDDDAWPNDSCAGPFEAAAARCSSMLAVPVLSQRMPPGGDGRTDGAARLRVWRSSAAVAAQRLPMALRWRRCVPRGSLQRHHRHHQQ